MHELIIIELRTYEGRSKSSPNGDTVLVGHTATLT
jgi:hypothetical protein